MKKHIILLGLLLSSSLNAVDARDSKRFGAMVESFMEGLTSQKPLYWERQGEASGRYGTAIRLLVDAIKNERGDDVIREALSGLQPGDIEENSDCMLACIIVYYNCTVAVKYLLERKIETEWGVESSILQIAQHENKHEIVAILDTSDIPQ